MFETATPSGRRTARRLALWAVAPLLAATIGGPAQAGPFKQNMQRMGQTTKAAKAELGAFDTGGSAALLRQYVEEAHEGETLSAGASAKAKDLQGRFARLAETAQAAAGSVTTAGQFRKTFGDIAAQCRSCHAVYK